MRIERKKVKKIVLAYSGGLDTSAIIPWLKENYDAQVIAFVADVGQGASELEGIEKKALNSGASECVIADLKEDMVKNYIYPTLKTGAIYEGNYLLGTSMARPIIAKAQVELAKNIGADALAHGCTGKGNDQVRFESCYAALAPNMQVIAPWREWHLSSRESLLSFLSERKIPCSASLKKIYSRDANVWHVSHEGGELEDPWNEPSNDVWMWTNSLENAPDKSELVHLSLSKGEIIAINNQSFSPYEALIFLNKIAARHGIGRVDIVENRLVGMKSRGCYETPGGTLMVKALQALDELVLDKKSRKWKETIATEFAQLIYDGCWFTPMTASLLAAANVLSEKVTGEVVLKLYKGNVIAIQKKSPFSLYNEDFATFGEDEVYNQSHAEGFIRLFSLPSRISALNENNE